MQAEHEGVKYVTYRRDAGAHTFLMRGVDPAGSRDLRLVLFDQILHTIEVLKVLLGILRDADLTRQQKAAVQHWERALPELREGVKVAGKSRTASRKPRGAAKIKSRSR